MQLFKSQVKEDVEMNDKTEIKTDKISYKKYYRQMGILGTLGGAMWILYWVMEKVLPAIKKGHTKRICYNGLDMVLLCGVQFYRAVF